MSKDSLQLFLSCLELERVLLEFQLSRLEVRNKDRKDKIKVLLKLNEEVRISFYKDIDESFVEVGVENEYIITCALEDLWRYFVEEDQGEIEFVNASFSYILNYFIWSKFIELFKSIIEVSVYQEYVKRIKEYLLQLDNRLGKHIHIKMNERFERVSSMKGFVNEQLNVYFDSFSNCIV